MNIVNVSADLNLSDNIFRSFSTYGSEWKDSLVRISGYPVFADNQFEDVKWNPDVNQTYNNPSLYNNNGWDIYSNKIIYDINPDSEDNAPLTTLYCMIHQYLLPRRIDVNGKVVVYIKNNDEYIAFSYVIQNLKFTYKVNESIELSRHWKNCNLFYLGQTIEDTNYPNCPLHLDPNPFKNFINNYSLYNSEDFIPEEIFEDTFNYLL